MTARTVVCIAIGLLLASCSSEDGVPNGIMGIKQMQPIMYDMVRAQELALMTNQRDTNAARQRMFELSQQVFTIHKINREDFFKSFHYYEENPDKIRILYDSVSAYANRKQQDIYMKLK